MSRRGLFTAARGGQQLPVLENRRRLSQVRSISALAAKRCAATGLMERFFQFAKHSRPPRLMHLLQLCAAVSLCTRPACISECESVQTLTLANFAPFLTTANRMGKRRPFDKFALIVERGNQTRTASARRLNCRLLLLVGLSIRLRLIQSWRKVHVRMLEVFSEMRATDVPYSSAVTGRRGRSEESPVLIAASEIAPPSLRWSIYLVAKRAAHGTA